MRVLCALSICADTVQLRAKLLFSYRENRPRRLAVEQDTYHQVRAGMHVHTRGRALNLSRCVCMCLYMIAHARSRRARSSPTTTIRAKGTRTRSLCAAGVAQTSAGAGCEHSLSDGATYGQSPAILVTRCPMHADQQISSLCCSRDMSVLSPVLVHIVYHPSALLPPHK